jgi:hypothetical protein
VSRCDGVIKFYLSRGATGLRKEPDAADPPIEKIVKDTPAVFAIRSKMSAAITILTTQAPAMGSFFIKLSLPN